MAQQTAQSVTATPGKIHSFVAKTTILIISGPFCVDAEQTYLAGAVTSQGYTPGAIKSQQYGAGAKTQQGVC
jgi:hypothetical protein